MNRPWKFDPQRLAAGEMPQLRGGGRLYSLFWDAVAGSYIGLIDDELPPRVGRMGVMRWREDGLIQFGFRNPFDLVHPHRRVVVRTVWFRDPDAPVPVRALTLEPGERLASHYELLDEEEREIELPS